MAVNMGNGPAVSGWRAKFAHGMACLCDLMQIFFFFFFLFGGIWRERDDPQGPSGYEHEHA